MRKEIFFAILAGALFGLVIAFGIWRANSSMKTNDSPSETPLVEESPMVSPGSEVGLTLAKPEDLAVVDQTPITISGITDADNWVTISTEKEDYLTQADSNGAFEEDVDLIGGVNIIAISAFDNAGNSNSTKLTIVYSSEFSQ